MKNSIGKLRKKIRAFELYKNQLGFVGTLLYNLRRLTVPKDRLIPVRLRSGEKLYLRNKSYDTIIFSQIFIYQELNFALPAAPRTIIDCGANIGLATLFFKLKYPNAQIISIEPESSNFELLKKNTAPFSDVHLMKKGIWSKTCNLYIIDLGEGNASFQVSETDPRKNVIGKVEAISINDIFNKFNLSVVDLLKMDIEGSEYNCFSYINKEWINNTGCLAIEIHEEIHPGCKELIDHSVGRRKYERNGEYHLYSKY